MKYSCENCKFVHGGRIQGLTCWRYPPTLTVGMTSDGMAMMSNFPPVKEEMSCGEYQQSIVIEEEGE